ncbi:MAG: glutamate--cysteine ligase [Holosporales bacterium]|jgi:glutamate--cysteine ligase
MTAVPSHDTGLIQNLDSLTAYLAAGCKPRTQWNIGTEHEKFLLTRDGNPLPYHGNHGIRFLLEALSEKFKWNKVLEDGNPIALIRGKTAISLEPGGQLELSGAPLATLHETLAELDNHFKEVHQIIDPLGINILPMGTHPTASRSDFPWVPKGRYAIMKAQMEAKGSFGLDMMLRTTTVQVNLDFSDETDMVRKYRTSLALQPICAALFANSPYLDGKRTGFLSTRSYIWTDTDPERCGMPDFVFSADMSFAAYTEYMLNVPMYFIYREGHYIDARGQSFRDFMNGCLPALYGERPKISDWVDHLSTAFPEVRLKQFLEMRGADAGRRDHLVALPALWVGLLYNDAALENAESLIKTWSIPALQALRIDAPRTGLNAITPDGRTIHKVAQDVLRFSRYGLEQRGLGEERYLDYLDALLANNMTAAEHILAATHGQASQALRLII